ncbi:MAG: hypothetical protein IJY58_03215 [Alphaproteobacteria bacterium]|nr:hypothetical protein [Alphaproteobacteria bacterium]
MDSVKSAISRLEEAVVQLETALHTVKKAHTQTKENSQELKQVVQTAYQRIDKIISTLKGNE